MSASAAHWPRRRLGDICEFKYGKSLPESARSGGEVPVYGSNGIVGGHDSPLTASATIVIGRKGSHGEVNFSDTPCWPIDTTYYVDSTATAANLHWLKYRLAGAGLNQMNRAAAVPGLNREDAYRVEILLPPIEEQRRIAAILDQAETLRAQRRQALAHLDTLTQSLFLDMFGDPVLNPKGLPVVKFGDVGTLDRGISKNRPRNAPELLGGDHPLVQTGEVSNCDGYIRSYTHTYSDIGLRQSKMWPVGTLCITIAANIAKTGILTFDACFPDSVVGFRADDPATVEYVRVWLSFLQKALEDSAPESAQKNINLAILRGLDIPLPPLPLQQTFATRIQAIEALKATHRTALAQLDALFASLQQRAFAGELTAQASSALAAPPAKRSFAELGQLDAPKGVESLIYAAKRLPGKGHYWPTKVQYFADKRHLARYGHTLYGETHVAMPYGPVPQAAFNASRALAKNELISEFPIDVVRAALRREGEQLIALRDADTALLGAQERESLEWAIRYVRDMNFEQLKAASHDAAWQKTVPNAAMAWRDIIATLEPEVQERLLKKFE